MNNDKKLLEKCGYDEETLNNMTEEDMESEVDLLTSGG